MFRGLFYHLYFRRSIQSPKHLFAPMITASYSSLVETDYNFHKSNSTYFADLDVARAHYVGSLVGTWHARVRANQGAAESVSMQQTSGKYTFALGAVSCFFRRQIEPLQPFEIYTRLLSWDRKWVYVVSHIVEKDAIKPERYTLQPWRTCKPEGSEPHRADEDLTRFILATSVSRYVIKKGRLTINPEVVLEGSQLLPPRPSGVGLPPRADVERECVPTPGTPATPAAGLDASTSLLSATQVTAKLDQIAEVNDENWTWELMEKERLRGLEIAMHLNKLSGAHDELRAGEVLGKFGDFW